MLLDTLLAVRRHSEALIAPLEPEDLMLQGMADATQFRYRAHWQATQQRIEMALVSTQDQTVHLGGEAWFFRQGDAWITEHSVKYSPDAAAALAAQAGWRIQRRWTDPHQQIALHLLLPAN